MTVVTIIILQFVLLFGFLGLGGLIMSWRYGTMQCKYFISKDKKRKNKKEKKHD